MFVPSSSSDSFPRTLTRLYNEDLLHVSYLELMNKCDDAFQHLEITCQQTENLGKVIRGQLNCGFNDVEESCFVKSHQDF